MNLIFKLSVNPIFNRRKWVLTVLGVTLLFPVISCAKRSRAVSSTTTTTSSTIINDSGSLLSTTSCTDSYEAPCSSPLICKERIPVFNTNTIEVVRSFSLTKTHCAVTRAIIVLHGRDRDPENYFDYIWDSAYSTSHTTDSLIISPYFREELDVRQTTDLYWKRSAGTASQYDWAMGGQSYSPVAFSSYSVIDKIISSIKTSNKFPNLKTIVVVGHSAGGQLAQRYALSGNYNNQNFTDTRFSYIVGNPSSYAYLNDMRPSSTNITTFFTPSSTTCSSFNNWGYGLLKPNNYVSKLLSTTLISQYISRNVTYLLGDADILSTGLDTTCAANLQGSNRYQRGLAYFNHINKFYITHIHKKVIVPGVGHSGRDMLTSDLAKPLLFY